MESKAKIFDELEKIAHVIPAPVFWLDVSGRVIGGNGFQVVGAKRPIEQMIGKTAYDFYPKVIAEAILKNIKEVVREKKGQVFEESVIDIETQRTKWFLTTRGPLFSDDGVDIIGVIETTVEVTERKERERLDIENAQQQCLIQEHEKFIKIAEQTVGELGRLFGKVLVIHKSYDEYVPDYRRYNIEKVSSDVNDCLKALLKNAKEVDVTSVIPLVAFGKSQVTMVADILKQFPDERYSQRYENIDFNYDFCDGCLTAFVEYEPMNFKHTMKIIFEAAGKALSKKGGVVNVKLDMDDRSKEVIVQVGCTEVEPNAREKNIVIMTLPMVEAPEWVAKDIMVRKKVDKLIILDTDASTSSIHYVWKRSFENYTKELDFQHLVSGEKTIEYVNRASKEERGNLLLLTASNIQSLNYLSGIDVIRKTGIKRSILVVDEVYINKTIIDAANKVGAKILPKRLIPEFKIWVV